MSDESIIPRSKIPPELQAEFDSAPDNGLGGDVIPDFALGGTVQSGTVEPMPVHLVCPICGLGECGHNLPKVNQEPA